MTEADRIIHKLGLLPHPEGGWYRQTWVGPMVNGRASGTAIFFLLKAGEASHWHRVDADEVWLWHAGSPVDLRISQTDQGPARSISLGPDVLGDQMPQAVVPNGQWQAARANGGWALVSCTVTPGFRFEGFTLAPPEFDIPRVLYSMCVIGP